VRSWRFSAEFASVQVPIPLEEELYQRYGFPQRLLFTTTDTNFSQILNQYVLPDWVKGHFSATQSSSFPMRLDVTVGVVDQKWQILDRPTGRRYAIHKQDTQLDVYQDAQLRGKGGLEDVDVFTEKTGLSRKELNDLALPRSQQRRDPGWAFSLLFYQQYR